MDIIRRDPDLPKRPVSQEFKEQKVNTVSYFLVIVRGRRRHDALVFDELPHGSLRTCSIHLPDGARWPRGDQGFHGKDILFQYNEISGDRIQFPTETPKFNLPHP